jgi:magnesium-protoporphyrin IX monomethyl ester (oxidative) cyclase
VILDIDHPAFRAGFGRLAEITAGMSRSKARGGPLDGLRRAGLGIQAAAILIRLYLLPTLPNEAPATVRLSPAW